MYQLQHNRVTQAAASAPRLLSLACVLLEGVTSLRGRWHGFHAS